MMSDSDLSIRIYGLVHEEARHSIQKVHTLIFTWTNSAWIY